MIAQTTHQFAWNQPHWPWIFAGMVAGFILHAVLVRLNK